MAVLEDIIISYRVGACSLMCQNDAPALRNRDWKEPNKLRFGARELEKMGRERW